jgi:sulfate permease, SulP family
MTTFLSGYQKEWFRCDATAGLTTAAVVIPKSMAYASIAGLPVQAGLYVALVPMLVYALLGSSRLLSVSTTGTLAILTATALARVVPVGGAAELMAGASALALMVGGFLIAAGVLRLGFLANFISDPVLTGFKGGIAIVLLLGQMPKLLGVHADGGNLIHIALSTFQHLSETNLATVIVSLATLAILFALHHFRPQAPAPLMAVAIGVAGAGILGLKGAGVALIGFIPAALPRPVLPNLALFKTLWPGALGLALMSFTESIAVARGFAKHNDPRPSANRELLALGVANLAGSVFQSFPAGGGASQTAVNVQAGARTQVSALATVAVVAATLLFLSPLVGLLPQATLAAIVVVTAVPLLSIAEFRSILAVRRIEFIWALATCVGVVLIGTLEGILVAIAISVFTLIFQANHPPVYVVGRKPGTYLFRPQTADHPEDETLPGLLILRTEGRMTFASAPHARERLAALIEEAHPQVVILECSAIPDFEYTALRTLIRAEQRMRESGVALWLSALNPRALNMVRRSALALALGPNHMFANLHDAVEAYEREATTHHSKAREKPTA